jgi:ParB family transcriptional regulator, chromosome partitioning protein
VDEFGLSPKQIADQTGTGRSAIVNFLRLLQLPKRVQEMVRSGKLSRGHAKALLALDDYAPSMVLKLAERAASLSVRERERLIAEVVESKVPDPFMEPGRYLRPEMREAQQHLRNALTAKGGHHRKPGLGTHPRSLRRPAGARAALRQPDGINGRDRCN